MEFLPAETSHTFSHLLTPSMAGEGGVPGGHGGGGGVPPCRDLSGSEGGERQGGGALLCSLLHLLPSTRRVKVSRSVLPIGEAERERERGAACTPHARASLLPNPRWRARSFYLEQRGGVRKARKTVKGGRPDVLGSSERGSELCERDSLGNYLSAGAVATHLCPTFITTRSSVFYSPSSFSPSLLGAEACVRATHMWICQLLTVATFVGIGGRGRTIEWTMRLVYRFASDCDRIVAPDE